MVAALLPWWKDTARATRSSLLNSIGQLWHEVVQP